MDGWHVADSMVVVFLILVPLTASWTVAAWVRACEAGGTRSGRDIALATRSPVRRAAPWAVGIVALAFWAVPLIAVATPLSMFVIRTLLLEALLLCAYGLARLRRSGDDEAAGRRRRTGIATIAGIGLAGAGAALLASATADLTWEASGSISIFVAWLVAPIIGLAAQSIGWARRDRISRRAGRIAAIGLVVVAVVVPTAGFDVPLRARVWLGHDDMDRQAEADMDGLATAPAGAPRPAVRTLAGFAVDHASLRSCGDRRTTSAIASGVSYGIEGSPVMLTYCPRGAPIDPGDHRHWYGEPVHLLAGWWLDTPGVG